MGKLAEAADCTDPQSGIVSSQERAPTREEMSELLETVAAASHPVRGRLKALAHVVRVLRRCPWIAGTVGIELASAIGTTGASGATTVHVFAEHGGRRQRALPSVVLAVPLHELRAALRKAPDLVAPLRISPEPCEPHAIVLTATHDGA
jgi:hypothetical protein